VMLFDKETGRSYRAGPRDIPDAEQFLREAASRGTHIRDMERHLTVTAIRLGTDPIGSLALAESSLSDGAMQGLANLVAIGIERARAYERASKAEAARQSDELKSTLLDAVAHEFITPLTSIKAASTALLSNMNTSMEDQRELLLTLDEEADRLSGLVTEAIQMARLESGKLHLNKQLCSAVEIVAGAVEPLRRALEGRPLEIEVSDTLPEFEADHELLQIALRQFIDNAVKYSPANRRIRIAATATDSQMTFTVEDEGPGIPEGERPKVFERFYRLAATRQSISGAGLGLAIAKDIAEAHGGTAWVNSDAPAGSAFHLSISLHKSGSHE
jgi:two-component system, OmpR family, sensor histidine kinase KdpD